MIDGEIIENEELNLKSDNRRNYKEAISVVEEYKKIIKCTRKGMLKKSDKFKEMLKETGVSEYVNQQYISK